MLKYCGNPACIMVNAVLHSDEIKFCSKCGQPLREVEKCEYCTHDINPNDKFCQFCGRPVE